MTFVAPFIVYLIHFPREVGGQSHYMGITREDRLANRLREHARGTGGATTKRLGVDNPKLALAAVWPVTSRLDEHRIKASGNYKRHCPICKSGDESKALSWHIVEHFNLARENDLANGTLFFPGI